MGLFRRAKPGHKDATRVRPARILPPQLSRGLTRSRGTAAPVGEKSPRMGLAMSFVHPLARGAKVWTATDHDDGERRILVIVTTIPLDPEQKGYKKSLVEKLSRAAREHLAQSKEAESFMLISRLREWNPPKG
jgi:hypothetical protein